MPDALSNVIEAVISASIDLLPIYVTRPAADMVNNELDSSVNVPLTITGVLIVVMVVVVGTFITIKAMALVFPILLLSVKSHPGSVFAIVVIPVISPLIVTVLTTPTTPH